MSDVLGLLSPLVISVVFAELTWRAGLAWTRLGYAILVAAAGAYILGRLS